MKRLIAVAALLLASIAPAISGVFPVSTYGADLRCPSSEHLAQTAAWISRVSASSEG